MNDSTVRTATTAIPWYQMAMAVILAAFVVVGPLSNLLISLAGYAVGYTSSVPLTSGLMATIVGGSILLGPPLTVIQLITARRPPMLGAGLCAILFAGLFLTITSMESRGHLHSQAYLTALIFTGLGACASLSVRWITNRVLAVTA